MATKYWVGGTGNWSDITHWSLASAVSFTASCSGTTLTTTGSPPLSIGMTVWVGNLVSLGTIVSGSGNSWVVSVGGTYSSQSMTAATVGVSAPTATDAVVFDSNSGSNVNFVIIRILSGDTCDWAASSTTGATIFFYYDILYWKGTVSSDWNVAANWSIFSDGSVSAFDIPKCTTRVRLLAAFNNPISSAITTDCYDFIVEEGYSSTFIHSATFRIRGSAYNNGFISHDNGGSYEYDVTFSSAMTLNFSHYITIGEGDGVGQVFKFDFKGKTIGAYFTILANAQYKLFYFMSSFTSTNAIGIIFKRFSGHLGNGMYVVSGATVTIPAITDNYINEPTTNYITVQEGGVLRFTGTSPFIHYTTGVYRINVFNGGLIKFAGTCTTIDTANMQLGTIELEDSANDVSFTNGFQINSLIMPTWSAAKTIRFSSGYTYHVANRDEVWRGTAACPLTLTTVTGTAKWTINCLTLDTLHSNVYYSTATEYSYCVGTNLTSTTNWNSIRYWVGGAGNWSDATHWGVESGESFPTSGVPLPSSTTDVYFDGNSGNGIVYLNLAGASCKSINFTGRRTDNNASLRGTSNFTGKFFFDIANRGLQIYGSAVFNPQMEMHINSNPSIISYQFYGIGNLDMNGVTIYHFGTSYVVPFLLYTGDQNSALTLQSDISFFWHYTSNNLSKLYTNGYNVTMLEPWENATTQTYKMTSGYIESGKLYVQKVGERASTVTVYGNMGRGIDTQFTLITCDAGTHIIQDLTRCNQAYFNYNCRFNCLAASVIHNLTIKTGTMLGINIGCSSTTSSATQSDAFPINGNLTIDGVAVANRYIRFASKTWNITGDIVIKGQSGYVAVMGALGTNRTAIPTVNMTINKAKGKVDCNYLSIQRCVATGGAEFYAGRGSTVDVNSTGWLLADYPSGNVILFGSLF